MKKILVFIVVCFFIAGVTAYVTFKKSFRRPIENTMLTAASNSSAVYTSPLGFSFKNPTNHQIATYDFSTFCAAMQNPSAPQSPTTTSAKATAITFSNADDILPTITVIKTDAIGSIFAQSQCAPGDITPYNLFYKQDTMYQETQSLIAKKILPSQTTYFNNKGISQRFAVSSYVNPSSHMFGITNLQIFGFAVPGLSIFREYFLHDPHSRFLFYIRYPVACAQQKAFEAEQNNMSTDATFNGETYIQKLHDLAPSCDEKASARTYTQTILNSITFP